LTGEGKQQPSLASGQAVRAWHGLTYTSCQQHDKRVDALRRNPALLFAMANDPEAHSLSNLALLLKALPLLRD
jgi:hypothetical protein